MNIMCKHGSLLSLLIRTKVAQRISISSPSRYSYFMELVTDPSTNNQVCQETWDKLPRLIYGGFTNITQVTYFKSKLLLYHFILVCDSICDHHYQLHQHHDQTQREICLRKTWIKVWNNLAIIIYMKKKTLFERL